MPRVDRDDGAHDRPPGDPQLLGLPHDGAAGGGDVGPKPPERRDGVRAHDPVGDLPDVALEVADGAIGLAPQDPVLSPGVEAERVQPALERANIVAPQERIAQIERAIPEPVSRLHELRPGIGTNESVHGQPPIRLEGADRDLGRRAEPPVELVGVDGRLECEQPLLHVSDVVAAVPGADDPHRASMPGDPPPVLRID